MPHSHTNFLYHIVYSTKERLPLIDLSFRARLHGYIGSIVADRGGTALAINGTADHVHALVKLRQDKAVSEIIRDMKAISSGWLRKHFREAHGFGWQIGYGGFSVSESLVERVSAYIGNQETHHRTVTFEQEFIALLRAHGIAFDERYLWR